MVLKFVPADAQSIQTKRRQVSRACQSCRKKKRRCIHYVSNGTDRNDSNLRASKRQRQDTESVSQNLEATRMPSEDTAGPDSRRFIGHLSPESVFVSAGGSNSVSKRQRLGEDVGIWLEKHTQNPEGESSQDQPSSGQGLFGLSSSSNHTMLYRLLEADCLSTLPPFQALDMLTKTYFDKSHPFLPIVDATNYQTMQNDQPEKVLIAQGICILASMNPSCSSHLLLGTSDKVLSPRDFAKHLFASMRCIIELELVKDKMILLQALSMMSMFSNDTDGADISSQFCARAVQTMHTLGLHHSDCPQVAENDHAARLFCCIWALDRFNAAAHGRAIMIHERDVGRDLRACVSSQKPAFRLLLEIVLLLDKVFPLYRPTTNTESSDALRLDDIPMFEDLVEVSGASSIPRMFLVTAEILYQAVVILACRPSSRNLGESSFLLHSQQHHAAAQITSLFDPTLGAKYQMVMLPFVPYSVSLSLSIAYREMRYTKLSFHRTIARQRLDQNCKILEQLANHFWIARRMSSMAKATLQEYDRVVETLREDRRERRTGNDLGHADLEQHGSGQEHAAEAGSSQAENLRQPTEPPLSTSTVTAPEQNLDFFEMFDPRFGLEEIDAFFQSTLDVSGMASLAP